MASIDFQSVFGLLYAPQFYFGPRRHFSHSPDFSFEGGIRTHINHFKLLLASFILHDTFLLLYQLSYRFPGRESNPQPVG